MAETTEVVIHRVLPKEGNKPWRVIDGNEREYATFNDDIGKEAEKVAGKHAKVTFSTKQKESNGRTFTNYYLDAIEVIANGDAPSLGTGDYVKGQTAPKDRAGMRAAVALQHAVSTLTHTLGSDTRAKEATERVLPLAEAYFSWLSRKAGDEAEDFPF